ncbi:MAG: DUF362 domain-containing protein [Promethearchaeota archaeon]
MSPNQKPIVSIARNNDLVTAVNTALDQIELPDFSGKTVLLKPNVGREADPKLGINTNPEVIEAVFKYLKKRFKANYLIGDSPIINTDTLKAFQQSGYTDLIKENDLKFIDLDERAPKELDIPDGKILKKIKVTGYWDEIDAIISIPCLKMHMHCGASLSFKNLKGLIYKREKIKLHHYQAPDIIKKYYNQQKQIKELDIAISDLAYIFQPALVIIDASYAHEGMGPSSGNPVKMDTIIASKDYLAADIIALALTQPNWTLEDVPHLKFISEILPKSPKSRKDIITIPENIEKFINPIEPPPTSINIKYENVNLISEQSCSACLSTIFNLLKNNKEFIDSHFSLEKPLNLAIGKGIKQSDLYMETYLIGNCTANQKNEGIFIQGCTPVESEIIHRIKKNLNID